MNLVGMTDQGKLIGQTELGLKIDTVPPGQTGQTINKIGIDIGTKRIWLAILDKNCREVMQIIVPVE